MNTVDKALLSGAHNREKTSRGVSYGTGPKLVELPQTFYKEEAVLLVPRGQEKELLEDSLPAPTPLGN